MKFSEFIEFYKNSDAKSLESVKINRYIPIEKKILIIDSINDKFLEAELDIEDPCKIIKEKELMKFFEILLSYIDVEIDNRSVETYDECMAIGVDDFILRLIQRKDYMRFCEMFEKTYEIKDANMFRNALTGIGKESLTSDLKKMTKELIKNKDIISNLNNIIGYNNIGIK